MNNLKVLTIANLNGGCGVTTISIALIKYFSKKDYKLLVIDLNQNTRLSNRFTPEYTKDKNKFAQSIADRINDFNSASDLLFLKSNIVNCEENVDALSVDEFCLMRVESNESINSKMKDFFTSVTDDYDIVIIDTLPSNSCLVRAAIECSTSVLIPLVADGGSGIDKARTIINLCENMNQNRSADNSISIKVFCNKHNKVEKLSKELLLYIQNDPFFSKYGLALYISSWVAYKSILDEKKSFFDTADKKAREQLTEFCQFILEQLLSTSK